MNLLLLSAEADPAGIARLQRFGEVLANAGHGLAVAVPPASTLLTEPTFCAAFPVDFGRGWNLRAPRQLRELERRARIDVLLAFDDPSLSAALALHLTGTPVLMVCLEPDKLGAPWRLKHGCCGVIAGSQGIANRLIAKGVSSDRITVIDLERNPPAAVAAIERACADAVR